MNAPCPPPQALHAALAANGREPAARKLVLADGWWLVDESRDVATRTRLAAVPEPGACLQPVAPDPRLTASVLEAARFGGWKIAEREGEPVIEFGGRRRARARMLEWPGRGPALCAEVLPEPCGDPAVVAAFVLRLTASLRLVRASLVDPGSGPLLVWDVPLKPADNSADAIIDALCCLAAAVQHGQAEAAMLAADPLAAQCWTELNFPPQNQH